MIMTCKFCIKFAKGNLTSIGLLLSLTSPIYPPLSFPFRVRGHYSGLEHQGGCSFREVELGKHFEFSGMYLCRI